jgi:hypothetical protein
VSSKVDLKAQCLVSLLMMLEILYAVGGQYFSYVREGLEQLLYSLPQQACTFKRHFSQQGHAALAI